MGGKTSFAAGLERPCFGGTGFADCTANALNRKAAKVSGAASLQCIGSRKLQTVYLLAETVANCDRTGFFAGLLLSRRFTARVR